MPRHSGTYLAPVGIPMDEDMEDSALSELSAISSHLQTLVNLRVEDRENDSEWRNSMTIRTEAILAQTKETNGRVSKHDVELAVERERRISLASTLAAIEARLVIIEASLKSSEKVEAARTGGVRVLGWLWILLWSLASSVFGAGVGYLFTKLH